VPLYLKNGEYNILFIKRTESVRTHKGQIAFPGGGYEAADRTLLKTALRECAEEIGLAADKVEVLGELDDEPSLTSNYVISPFVGIIPWPYPFMADGTETEEIIEIPIKALLSVKENNKELSNGDTADSYSFNYEGRIIWGATARILSKFLEIWAQASEDK